MTHPVAVLMAAYNAEKTIFDAVASLLHNTQRCKIYIIDDCSRVPVNDIIGLHDPSRIEVIRLDKNVGPAGARNAGIERILKNGHPYIAVMDADDRAHPERLATQVAFLESNPSVALVGAWERVIDHNGEFVSNVALPCDAQEIRSGLFIKMCVSHPTWMVRSEVFATLGGYSHTYYAAEDYEFVRRVAAHHDVANVPEYLIDYRLSPGGMTANNRKRQLIDRLRIQFKYFEFLKWQAWYGVARTIALLVIPAKRRLPDTLSHTRARKFQSA
jgi:glycosyltransferase involved in cell wall biosynthesis